MEPPKSFKLHPMDFATPPFNVRLHLLFKPASVEPTAVRDALFQALSEPVRRAFPAAFGRLGPDRLHILLSGSQEPGFDFQFSRAPSLTASTVHKPQNSYELGALPIGLAPNLHLLGVKLTVLADDSLYLAFAINHFIADFAAFLHFLRFTCSSTSRILNGGIDVVVPRAPSQTLNRDYFSLFRADNVSNDQKLTALSPLPGYRHGISLSAFSTPESAPPIVTQVTLILLTTALPHLKRAASPINAAGQWVSTADAVTALLWRSTTRAKAACRRCSPTDSVRIAMAVDLRSSATVNDINHQFWGNCVREGILSLSLSVLCDETKLSETALAIRRCLVEARKRDSIVQMLHWYEDAAEQHARVPTLSLDPIHGLDHVTSNWSCYDMLEPGLIDLGLRGARGLGGPVSLDTGGFPLPRGISVIMRAGRDGNLKAQLGLSRDEAVALASDVELLRYASVAIESD